MILDGEIVNVDVAAGAAIAGTRYLRILGGQNLLKPQDNRRF